MKSYLNIKDGGEMSVNIIAANRRADPRNALNIWQQNQPVLNFQSAIRLQIKANRQDVR